MYDIFIFNARTLPTIRKLRPSYKYHSVYLAHRRLLLKLKTIHTDSVYAKPSNSTAMPTTSSKFTVAWPHNLGKNSISPGFCMQVSKVLLKLESLSSPQPPPPGPLAGSLLLLVLLLRVLLSLLQEPALPFEPSES